MGIKYYKAIESLTVNDELMRIAMRGYCMDVEGVAYTDLEVYINGELLDKSKYSYTREDRMDIKRELIRKPELSPTDYIGFRLTMPDVDLDRLDLLEVYAVFVEKMTVDPRIEKKKLLSKSRSQLKSFLQEHGILYHIDFMRDVANVISIHGWAATTTETLVHERVIDENGKEVSIKWFDIQRDDVVAYRSLCKVQSRCGFNIHFSVLTDMEKEFGREQAKKNLAENKYKKYYLLLETDKDQVKIPLDVNKIIRKTKFEKTLVYKTYVSYRKAGMKQTAKKVGNKLLRRDAVKYAKWYSMMKPTKEQLEKQRTTRFEVTPTISFVVPMYRTNEKFLKELIDSFLAQTYSKWELCFADGSGEGFTLEVKVKEFAKGDERIKYKNIGENKGIAGNSNEALAMASGEYIALCDHDDVIPPQTAFRLVECINLNPDVQVIYTDEDKIDMKGKTHFGPNFKPDFDIDLLRSMNYICHLFMIRRDILDEVKGFSSEYDGAQDYDFIFRCTEAAKDIRHIHEVLYHWRCHMESTAQDPDSKRYAFEAGRRAIDAHYQRMGLPAHAVHGRLDGMYDAVYEWKEKPLVSILIPNKDHSADLHVALSSVLDKSTYENYEIIIIENNSTEKETFEYYKKMEAQYPDKIRVVYWKEGFNYSAINNFGETFANGEYLLLLNNDVEVINPQFLEEMLKFCQRDDVAGVGARLYYNDNTIQHAGVIVGLGGVAGHCFPDFERDDPGYMGRIAVAQDYSACTAACLMVKRSVFKEVGGLDPAYAVAFNDVDLCLKMVTKGYKIVYNPAVELYHYESKSRGKEDTPEKMERFAGEIELFHNRWRDFLLAGDPYYNRNLTIDKNNFELNNPYHKL